MLAKLPPWRARHFVPGVIVFLLLLLSHHDRVYVHWDDVNNIAPGRDFPLPEYGHYIGGRVVDNFFHGFLSECFLSYVAPLLGLDHIIDAQSAFATLLFAVTSLGVLIGLYAFLRLFVELRPAHFVTFSLCAYVYMLSRFDQGAATGYAGYTLPLALSLGLLYPCVRLAVFGDDAFAARSPHATWIGMGLLAYIVGVSVTNIELFTLGAQLLCTAVLLHERAGSLRPRALPDAFRSLPRWFRLVTVVLPLTIGTAMFFDLTSGRFQDEKRQRYGTDDFEPLSLLDGLRSLPLGGGTTLNTIAALATIGGVYLLLRNVRRARREGVGRPLARLSKLLIVLVPTCVAYWLFVVRMSNIGGKDYFQNDNFCAYLVIVFMMPMLTALFALTREGRAALPATFLIAIVSVHGMHRLNHVPVREISKAEAKGVFDSLFMCYSHGVERVPVFIRGPALGWTQTVEEDWFIDAHRKVLRDQIIGYGGYFDPAYRPRIVRVPSVNQLHAELDHMRRTRPLLSIGLEDSPYFIDTSVAPRPVE